MARKDFRPTHSAPVLVIGLGRFGSATAAQLVHQNKEVLAVEKDPVLVQKWSGDLTHVVEADATAGLADPAYIRARSDARRLAGPEGIDAALAAHQLDALVAPTTGVAWPIRSEGDDFPGESYSAAAVAGYPSLTVPMGQINGLPVGLLFMGTAWSEPKLIEMAYAYEQRTRARRPPHFDTDALIDAGEP